MFAKGKSYKALVSLLLSAAMVTSTASFSAYALELPEFPDDKGFGSWFDLDKNDAFGFKSDDLKKFDLGELNLDELNLDGLNLDGLNLDGLNLDGLNLDGLNLDGLNLDGLNLDGLNLDGLNLDELKGLSREELIEKLQPYIDKVQKHISDNLPDPLFDGCAVFGELEQRVKDSKWDLDNIDEFIQSLLTQTGDVPMPGCVFGDDSFFEHVKDADGTEQFRVCITFPVHEYSDDLYNMRTAKLPEFEWDGLSEWNRAVKELSVKRGAFMDVAEVYNKKYIEALGFDPAKVDIDKEFPAFETVLTKDKILELMDDCELPFTIYEADVNDLADVFYSDVFKDEFGIDLSEIVKVYVPKIEGIDADLAMDILRKGVGLDESVPTDENGNVVSLDLDFDSEVSSTDAMFALRASVGLEKDYTAAQPYVYTEVDLKTK